MPAPLAGAAAAAAAKLVAKKLATKTVKKTTTITTGKAKAAMKMAKAGQYDSNTKGLGLVKGSNKKTAKAKKELGTFDTVIQKHPLIRNTGQSSAEGKYRYSGGKSIPIKKRGK
jgi:glycerate-2-kinase